MKNTKELEFDELFKRLPELIVIIFRIKLKIFLEQ